MISLLIDYEYDLLIMLGDYAYDMDRDNGKFGDEYFKKMEVLFTKAPTILVAGNHDVVDNSRFFLTRF